MSQSAPDTAPIPLAPDAMAAGSVPHRWQIACIEFRPARDASGDLLGFARFELAGGMVLSGVCVARNRYGIKVMFSRSVAMKGDEPKRGGDGSWLAVKLVDFPRTDDWRAFSNAAIAAIRAAFPDALPDDARGARQTARDAPAADALPDFLHRPVTRPSAPLAPTRAPPN